MKHLALALLLAPTLFTFVPKAHACSCMMPKLNDQFKRSDIIFYGQVTDIRTEQKNEWDGTNYFTFLVENTYKGEKREVVTITSHVSEAMCGIGFEKGKYEVVFANMNEDGTYTTNLCTGTKLFTPEEVEIFASSTSQSSEPTDCTPYTCADGSLQPRCSENGYVINYFAEPCFGHDTNSSLSPDVVPNQPRVPREPFSIFSDVDSYNPQFEAISFVKNKKIVNGYNDNSYKPNAYINRAEFTKILVGSADINTNVLCRIASFPDAPLGEWYGPYVQAARCRGIIGGYPDGTFRPTKNVNYAEAAKIVVETFNLEVSQATVGQSWYEPYLEALETYNAVPSGNHFPNENVTRGDMAEIIFRIMTTIDLEFGHKTSKPGNKGVSNGLLMYV